jgi:KDO2-lipid IV(A) lauroyltransferase
MNFQQFATTEFGTRLWMALGRWLPPRVGYALARVIAEVLGRRTHSALYRTIYVNQANVLGPDAAPERVHAAVRAVFRHAGLVSYDLMHIVGRGEAAIHAAVEWGPQVWANVEAARAGGRGVMICGCHLSNFNLAMLSFALKQIPIQVLSMAAPVGGFRLMQDLRARGLLEETPINGSALRQALARLRTGGIVGTALDWPVPTPAEERLPFFGRPAQLPTGHVRLALSARAALLPMSCRWDPQRGYYVQTAPPLVLEETGDTRTTRQWRAADVRHNALRVLAIGEKWIAETPDQWLMYHPVWG